MLHLMGLVLSVTLLTHDHRFTIRFHTSPTHNLVRVAVAIYINMEFLGKKVLVLTKIPTNLSQRVHSNIKFHYYYIYICNNNEGPLYIYSKIEPIEMDFLNCFTFSFLIISLKYIKLM